MKPVGKRRQTARKWQVDRTEGERSNSHARFRSLPWLDTCRPRCAWNGGNARGNRRLDDGGDLGVRIESVQTSSRSGVSLFDQRRSPCDVSVRARSCLAETMIPGLCRSRLAAARRSPCPPRQVLSPTRGFAADNRMVQTPSLSPKPRARVVGRNRCARCGGVADGYPTPWPSSSDR